jgi:hypothetical protein
MSLLTSTNLNNIHNSLNKLIWRNNILQKRDKFFVHPRPISRSLSQTLHSLTSIPRNHLGSTLRKSFNFHNYDALMLGLRWLLRWIHAVLSHHMTLAWFPKPSFLPLFFLLPVYTSHCTNEPTCPIVSGKADLKFFFHGSTLACIPPKWFLDNPSMPPHLSNWPPLQGTHAHSQGDLLCMHPSHGRLVQWWCTQVIPWLNQFCNFLPMSFFKLHA